MSDTKMLMQRYFHYLVWTLHMSLVLLVLSEYRWCFVTKSVYISSGIFTTQAKV